MFGESWNLFRWFTKRGVPRSYRLSGCLKCPPTHRYKDFECKPHYDSGNIGESVMLGLGDYSEGYLCIEDELTKKVSKTHTYHNLIKFNGSKNKHWTAPFTGERFTLVFYNNTRF